VHDAPRPLPDRSFRIVDFWQPMRRKLPLLITALLFAAVATCSWLAYRKLATALIAAAGERVTSVSTPLAAVFTASEDRVKLDKRRGPADSAFLQFLGRGDARSERRALAALAEYRSTSDQIVAVELWSRGRRVLASTSADYRPGQLDSAPVTAGFASRSLLGPFVSLGDTVFSETRLPVVAAAGDTIGHVRQFQRLADRQGGALVRTLIGSDAVLLIGNASGNVWTDLSRRVDAPPGSHTVGAASEATAPDGTEWVGATAAVSGLPWVIWVALPRQTVLAPARALLRDIALVAFVIIGIGGLAAWLLSRSLTRPLDEVIAAAEGIAAGDYSRRVSVNRRDEMGRLAAAFNTMTGQIEAATHFLEAQQLELELGNQELAQAVDRADRTAAELRALVQEAPLGICTLDPDGLVLSWNPAAERIFGWTAAEVMGRFQPSISQDQAGEFADHRRQLIEGEQLNGRLVRRRRKDGTTIQVSLSGAALHDPAGSLVGLVAIFDDVTERIHTQTQLASERKFLRQIIDINPNFLFAKDRDGRFTLANQAVADAYGTSTEALIGKSDADFNPNAAEVEAFRLADLEVIDSGATQMIAEEPITTASGKVRWLHTVKRPIIGENGRADQLLGVSTDITDRKQLEAQLLQSQKMEAVGQLAGGVAHDFNNVLAAIKGFSELIALELDEHSPIRSDVAEISAAADRAAALTQQLLAFSRRQLLQPVVLSPNTVVEGVSKLLLRLIGAEVRCETRLAASLGRVLADPGQLEQVLVNLAVNARDAMPSGGTLTIETDNVTLDGEHAGRLSGVETVNEGEYVVLAVSDTGVGMSQATQTRIFEPFFTTKDPGKGTGLGLSTVYGIVRQSGGYVSVYSELGHGTTFRVYLPRVEGAVLTPAARTREAARTDAVETILVVDDDTSVRAVASRILTRVGYTVLTASSAREAETLWTQHAGEIHLLMTDVMMPDMDGGELARRFTRSRADARVLYTSGYTNDSVIGRGLITPDTIFLAKPFAIEAVLRKVREALAT
jgi:PAS domain S-box-containing protein